MKKVVLSLMATLLISSIAIAKCHTINFGLGSYTWGTYNQTVTVWVYSESAGTFIQQTEIVVRSCNGGDNWEWIWN